MYKLQDKLKLVLPGRAGRRAIVAVFVAH